MLNQMLVFIKSDTQHIKSIGASIVVTALCYASNNIRNAFSYLL
jgi:hypothetical protein